MRGYLAFTGLVDKIYSIQSMIFFNQNVLYVCVCSELYLHIQELQVLIFSKEIHTEFKYRIPA